MLKNILLFLPIFLCVSGFAAFVDKDFCLRNATDLPLLGRVDGDGLYAEGALWVRRLPTETLLCKRLPASQQSERSEEAVSYCRKNVELVLRSFPDRFVEVFRGLSLSDGSDADKTEKGRVLFPTVLYAWYSQLPKMDVVCAVVCAMQEKLTGKEDGFDGKCHPVFSSFARYDAQSGLARASDREIFCPAKVDGRYVQGSIWIDCCSGAKVLCYRPRVAAPDWLCYRQNLDVPEGESLWLPGMRWCRKVILDFCDQREQAFEDFAGCDNAQTVVDCARSTLTGFSEVSSYAPEKSKDVSCCVFNLELLSRRARSLWRHGRLHGYH